MEFLPDRTRLSLLTAKPLERRLCFTKDETYAERIHNGVKKSTFRSAERFLFSE